MQSQYFGDFMQAVVNEVPTTNVAKAGPHLAQHGEAVGFSHLRQLGR